MRYYIQPILNIESNETLTDKPAERMNLLASIRNKIEGHADKLISNRREPNTLKEFISLLKSAFARVYDLEHAHNELKTRCQAGNERVEIYGERVNDILNCGLEVAKEKFNPQQLLGVKVLLNQAAVTGFVRGLRDQFISLLITKEQYDDLKLAINLTSKLEQQTEKRMKQSQNCRVMWDREPPYYKRTRRNIQDREVGGSRVG